MPCSSWRTRRAGPAVPLEADGRELRKADGSGAIAAFPGGPSATPPSPRGVAVADWNSDYRLDLVLAGAGGVRFLRQKEDGSFEDVTAATGLGPEVLGVDAFGVWAADIELDGDLDFVVGVRAGPTIVLRNNGDGTFEAIPPFAAVARPPRFRLGRPGPRRRPGRRLPRRRGDAHGLRQRAIRSIPGPSRPRRSRGQGRDRDRRPRRRRCDGPPPARHGRDSSALGPRGRPLVGRRRGRPLVGPPRRQGGDASCRRVPPLRGGPGQQRRHRPASRVRARTGAGLARR